MTQSTTNQPQSRRTFAQILAGSWAVLLALVLLGFTNTAKAQTTDVAKVKEDTASSQNKSPEVEYQESLQKLVSLYEQEVKRLSDENEKLKQLYADGVIARVELEESDKKLAEAKARVTSTQTQIAQVSLKPAITAAPVGMSSAIGTSNQAWTTGNAGIDSLIRANAVRNGLDPYLVFCLINQESSFAPNVTSPKGAQGLMQLMPGTAAHYGVTNPFDAGQNIAAGSRYLKDLLQMFGGRLDLALAGYNAGEGAVIKYGYQIPPYSETQNYVKLITMRYARRGGKK